MNAEPELVLVEDKNDFVDPLDLADEYEDVNDEDKLQLDDAIDEESEFQMEDSDDFGYASSQRAGSDRLKTEATTCLDSDDYDDCHDEYDGFDDSDSDDFFNSPLMPKRNIEHSTETNCLKSEPSHIKKECVKNVAHKVRLSPQMVDDDLSEDDISIGKNSRKTRKASQKGNEKQPKRESNDKNEPMEPRLYKHKKDYRKLLQQYEEMKKFDPNVEKPTRKYSKRNEIPKVTKHMEAYDKKLLLCKICDMKFERSPPFTEHMRDKHSIDKPFECHICGKGYRISSLLAEHIRYHYNEKPYKCEHCDRSFCQLQPYKNHLRKFHTFEKPYRCAFVDANGVECGISFYDTKALKIHSLAHADKHPYSCEECDKSFNHSSAYVTHMRIHRNERPFQCSICGKAFVQMSSHKAHMLTHSDVFNFPCTECDKKFKQAHNLRLHMRVHTKETPYICEDCGRQFAQLVTYRCHRRLHTGETPYACTHKDCPRRFRHKNSLRRHLQAHSGLRPFQCEICAKPLSHSSTLAKHMRKHEKRAEKK